MSVACIDLYLSLKKHEADRPYVVAVFRLSGPVVENQLFLTYEEAREVAVNLHLFYGVRLRDFIRRHGVEEMPP